MTGWLGRSIDSGTSAGLSGPSNVTDSEITVPPCMSLSEISEKSLSDHHDCHCPLFSMRLKGLRLLRSTVFLASCLASF
jgi:hypothetical protein